MTKKKLLSRLTECLTTLHRSGVTEAATQRRLEELAKLDGPGVSGRVTWMRRVEAACIAEAEVYADMPPHAWVNLTMLHPTSEDLKRIRALRRAVRDAWKS